MVFVDSQVDVNSVSFTYPFLEGIDPTAPPSTISIPHKYLDAMANMERQYWDIKSKHYNVVVFFKKGKFYELYDYDAVIANREFGLKMVLDTSNRGKMRLAGVPEQSYNEWARLFVFRGYKVGRVEQMKESESEVQTAKMKVVPRELVEVLTPGTLKDPSMLSDHREVFVLSLAPVFRDGELVIDAFAVDLSRRVAYRCPCGSRKREAKTGCDTISSSLSIKRENGVYGSLKNSTLRALSALLQQLSPKEVIISSSDWVSNDAERRQTFKHTCDEITKWTESEGFSVEHISSRALPSLSMTTMVTAEQVMTSYFTFLCLASDIAIFSTATEYTTHLSGVIGTDSETAASDATLDGAASGKSSIMDYEHRFDKGLVLDATTVSNLEVLTNLHDGSEKHSLNECLNRCSTNGGRRLFRSWLLRPSASSRVIAARQDAVQFLTRYNLLHSLTDMEVSEQVGEKRSRSSEGLSLFSSVVSVDFERFLSRLSDIRQNDSQKIAYVDPMVQYKKNLGIILSSVRALSAMVGWGKQFFARCREVACEQGTGIPALLGELLEEVTAAEASNKRIEGLFDRQAAEESGLLIPSPGTSSVFDAATTKLRHVESKLHDVRRQLQQDVFRGAQAHFTDLGKDLFLIEVAVADAPKMTPAGMVERARSAKSVKYVVSSIEALVESHKEATAMKAGALLTVLCSVSSRICDEFPRLFSASRALSYIDCLLSLAQLHHAFPTVCYPRLCTAHERDVAVVRGWDMIHPLLTGKNPVANNVSLDDAEGRVLLLTGPNMAGKSTLMRTVALNVLLAQLGGPVLATRMELSPVDRVFTRIGARDASHKGQSTLYVELSETADILHSASARSLCLVDELGRGTSTHDGMAIAYATLHALTTAKPAAPLTIFSTHYHALAMEQARTATPTPTGAHTRVVQLGYMDFVLKSETATAFADEDANDTSRSCAPASCVSNLVFLYRLVRGICARSYGVEVAVMAGIPHTLVQLAKAKSEALSRETAFHEDVRGIEKFIRA
ncbi:putative mismatch repair protein MSH8 [Leishmania mexicana MHOM/GT/2001/U1103]|uniref:Mismatch repair protein MSH8 n=2 Tax=Leishmania mexicana TaxID=5665 RepID=E9ASW9_LEIMU|nr:putative mismatch repair protein MSH8 [Leishmania mexicana MHOM/GT/2001/U1103]CBZ26043.1 putative mismatch repair protein MSH8 [Leishmania mexicana MHOM/GT/2001/U1103]